MNELELIPMETSEKVRFPRSIPYIVLRSTGASYINAKAAALLEIVTGDLLRFYKTADGEKWFLAKHPTNGATVYKNGGCMQFSDTPNARKILAAMQVNNHKASFPLGTTIEEFTADVNVRALFITPKPFNIE